jgi:hypothetical protein
MKNISTFIILTLCISCQSTAPTLVFPNNHPPLNKLFSFEIELKESVDELNIDADMPSHGHGMITQPSVTKISPSRYQVDGMILHMPGYWEIYVMTKKEKKEEKFLFPIQIEPWQ